MVDARWIYYSLDRKAAARWQNWFGEFLDPAHIEDGPVCGPEGQISPVDIELNLETVD